MILRALLISAFLGVPQDASRFSLRAVDGELSVHRRELVGRLVDEGLERLEPRFPRAGHAPFEIVIHDGPASVPRHIRAAQHPQTPGFALLGQGEIHLIMSRMGLAPPNDLRSVIDHELVHVLLHEQAGAHGQFVPRWFHEGLAQELAGGAWNGFKEEDLVFRVSTATLLPFYELRDRFPLDRMDLAYGQSWSFVAFLRREFGLESLLGILDHLDDETDFRAAFYRELRRSRHELEDAWHSYLVWDSGAGARSLYRNCFSFLIILAIPLLALAVARRLRRERSIRAKLAAEEVPVELHGPPWPPPAA